MKFQPPTTEQKAGLELQHRYEGIELHYLPPYSPNLNPIERLWKVMNEEAKHNKFFTSAREFRDSIEEFFEKKLSKIASSLRGRNNDDFQAIIPVPPGCWIYVPDRRYEAV